MIKKLLALVIAAILMAGTAAADIEWRADTEGQRLLKAYVEQVNVILEEQGEEKINTLFEMYQSFAVLGITDLPEATVPEGVEITVNLFPSALNSVEVRVNDPDRFARIAAAFIKALSPEAISMEDAYAMPEARVRKVKAAPGNSFEESVEQMNGTMPYIYYSYRPNELADGVNWMVMTIIFPMEGSWNGSGLGSAATETNAPDTYSDHDEEYEGYYSSDDFSHFEIFSTPTPEPDSAAGGGYYSP